jgi:glycerophosphoryl diester phosphodiesterase
VTAYLGPDTKLPGQFILTAHRGGLFYRPENSMAAFAYSADLGVEWAECDVRLSADGVPVLHHDERISLPVGAGKAVREMTAAQLASVDIGGGETVPTLSELLVNFGKRIRFDIELKELDTVEKVIPLVHKTNLLERSILSSFILEALQTARDLEPNLARGLLVDRLTGRIVGGKSAVRAAALLGCHYFLPHYRSLTSEWVTAAQQEGMLVIPWTVNRAEDALRLIELGVDGLISDRPDQFLSLIPRR